ncbi:hypothetical protein Tco_0703344 [Tanacetum coccineum]|uniref:Uncharacterized protein n=1 Tax=Tanacetum coccineum TaxID=301880 RepID=A0ABQ4Y0G2_9ASTR
MEGSVLMCQVAVGGAETMVVYPYRRLASARLEYRGAAEMFSHGEYEGIVKCSSLGKNRSASAVLQSERLRVGETVRNGNCRRGASLERFEGRKRVAEQIEMHETRQDKGDKMQGRGPKEERDTGRRIGGETGLCDAEVATTASVEGW